MSYTISKMNSQFQHDKNKIDIEYVHGFLTTIILVAGHSIETVKRAIENSLCFGVYQNENEQQVGFARVITDKATFAYLADVFIDENYRGKGLGKWLMKTHHGSSRSAGLAKNYASNKRCSWIVCTVWICSIY